MAPISTSKAKYRKILLAGLLTWLILAGAAFLLGCNGMSAPLVSPSPQADSAGEMEDITGFDRAEGPTPILFPQDYGAHPDFQTEWWYYTGNLATREGRQFGYQLTFFRRALLPPQLRPARASEWGTDQVYLAHFAITDVENNQHAAFEETSRGAAGLAGAHADPFQVWLRDWSVEQVEPGAYRLRASEGGWALDLKLKDLKEPVLQGDQGYSRKGAQPGNASFYFSQPRLATEGTIRSAEGEFSVSGDSWMDHEYSTSALSSDQTGWDWFALQLEDGSELVLFTLRKEDGSIDAFSSGAIILQDGSSRRLNRADFDIEVLKTWESPDSGGIYPAGWRILIPSEELELTVLPLVEDQELDLRYVYWEGAVDVQGVRQGKPIRGQGYVELTGYAGSFAGKF